MHAVHDMCVENMAKLTRLYIEQLNWRKFGKEYGEKIYGAMGLWDSDSALLCV